MKLGEERPDRRLRSVAEHVIEGCGMYRRLVKDNGGNAAGKTRLDRERHKLCLREVVSIHSCCVGLIIIFHLF